MAFFTVCVRLSRARRGGDLVVCSASTLTSDAVLALLLHCPTPLRLSSPAKVSCDRLAVTSGLGPQLHSCPSSSSSSWSSSMASIWSLGLTSLMGAESLPSTTSSLDSSLFRCSKKKKKACPRRHGWKASKMDPEPKTCSLIQLLI